MDGCGGSFQNMNEEQAKAGPGQPGTVKRLFVAHRLEHPAVNRELDEAWRKVHQVIPRWSKPQRERHHHITLRFIGEVDTGNAGQRERLEQLENDLREVAGRSQALPMLLGLINTFPGIAWGAVGGTYEAIGLLRKLRKEVDKAVTKRFPEADVEHGFIPHITLGKFDVSATEAVDEKLRGSEYPAPIPFSLDSIELLESVQSPLGEGADHTAVIPKLMLQQHQLPARTGRK